MKLSEAWRRLAEYYDGLMDKNGRVRARNCGGPWLCNNIKDALGKHASCAHHDTMYTRIHEDIALIDETYWGRSMQTYDLDGYSNHPADNAARVLVCLMFAEEAEDAERAANA